MNMKLYGICFKLRGGPDLLDHVQENEPVPVEMMGQVMDQIGSLTEEEINFAKLLAEDWKKAFSERVPLTMAVADDKGYDITCSVPDELVEAVSLITGKTPVELMKEYASDHMKNVLGIDADILSVDAEHEDNAPIHALVQPQEFIQSGFSMSDLDEEPVTPAFEDVSAFAEMNMGMDIPVEGFKLGEEASEEERASEGEKEAAFEEGNTFEGEEEAAFEEGGAFEGEEEAEFGESGIPLDGPDDEPEYYEEPDITEEEMDAAQEEEAAGTGTDKKEQENDMANAVAGIYKDMVKNIKDRRLDERLGLKIGQTQ